MKKLCVFLPVLVVLFSCASTQTGPSGKDLAEQARDKAVSVKAEVAAKDEFAAAQAAFDEAASLESGNKAAAQAKYQEAEGLFNAVYESVKSRRDAAQKELDKARSDIKNVEAEAAELDRIRKGGS